MQPPVVGEPLALDLINTRLIGPDGAVDVLATGDGLEVWLAAEAGRLSPQKTAPTAADADRVRGLREHIASAIGHARLGNPPPGSALRALSAARSVAPAHVGLVWSGTAVTATIDREGELGDVLVAELAQSAIDLLTDSSLQTIRECAHPDCVLLFVPTRQGRQWCSPRCGNRARVARYYRRHKAGHQVNRTEGIDELKERGPAPL